MKKITIVALALGAAICLFAFTNRRQEPSQVIMIRGYILVSAMGGRDLSTIKVYNGSRTEITELGKVNSKTAFDESMNEVLATVNKYVAQGYAVQSATEVPGGSVVILNYTLTK